MRRHARSFLLQLSLLDLDCSGFSASLLGAASLRVALAFFGKEEWPAAMQQYAVYSVEELDDVSARLISLQSMLVRQLEGWRD